MEKEQGKLIIIVSVVFAMVLLYIRQCAGGKVIAGMYAGSSQRPG